jgi:hypothetical protein
MADPVITLLTDFGLQDAYGGVMKGVMAAIAPTTTVIDLTHAIPPQDIAAARFQLMNAYPFFPPGTVHVVVVDPGVGSQRRAIALKLADGILVGPDNGVFSSVLSQHPVLAAVRLDNPHYWRSPSPSTTFHGRDIFAPVAAHLATGVDLEAVGTAIDPDSLVRTGAPTWTVTETGISGTVQHIDHFGNLITTIPASAVGWESWTAQIRETPIPRHRTYAAVAPGQCLSLIGSHGWVEIAVNGGSARDQLTARVGDMVKLKQN